MNPGASSADPARTATASLKSGLDDSVRAAISATPATRTVDAEPPRTRWVDITWSLATAR
jgi:hypothetical protein